MAELRVDEAVTDRERLRVERPADDRQSCATCVASRVQAVMMTIQVVYLRCEECGEVWSIVQRRRRPRSNDPRRF
jgi:hypothetical protein